MKLFEHKIRYHLETEILPYTQYCVDVDSMSTLSLISAYWRLGLPLLKLKEKTERRKNKYGLSSNNAGSSFTIKKGDFEWEN